MSRASLDAATAFFFIVISTPWIGPSIIYAIIDSEILELLGIYINMYNNKKNN